MKRWTALLGGLLAVHFGLGGLLPQQWPFSDSDVTGTSFVTQASQSIGGHEYETTFGDDWQSVRIFRLLNHLDSPLKVYIETRPRQSSLYKSQYRSYIEEGLRSWSEALDNRLSFTYTRNRADADITVDWVPSFSDKYVAGLTTYRVGHAQVEIKTVGIPEMDIKSNIIHEIGHALGITGHSSNPNDIMVGVRRWHRDPNSGYNPKLSARDKQAIRRLYSQGWRKGEDLYSQIAQHAPTPVIANRTEAQPQQEAKALTRQAQPQGPIATNIENSSVIVWSESHATEAAPATTAPAKPVVRYTQIFH